MSRRTKCTVKNVVVSPFLVDGERPFVFSAGAKILVNIVRAFADGREETACLEIDIKPGYKTDGASTFWPISKLVPQWRDGDDEYNAGPVAHDVLYLLEGIVEGEFEPVKLSREEVDDILRGIWRCWGMRPYKKTEKSREIEDRKDLKHQGSAAKHPNDKLRENTYRRDLAHRAK